MYDETTVDPNDEEVTALISACAIKLAIFFRRWDINWLMKLNIHHFPVNLLMNYFLHMMGLLRGDVILSLSLLNNFFLQY